MTTYYIYMSHEKHNTQKRLPYVPSRAYRHLSIDIDVLGKIDELSHNEGMSFTDALNFLLRDALGLNDHLNPEGEIND